MTVVGVRELKNHLSRYLREVEGTRQPIAVTDHGRLVAYLQPISVGADTPELSFAERIRSLHGEAATQNGGFPRRQARAADWVPVDVGALLDETRGER